MTTFATIVSLRFDIFDMITWCTICVVLGMWIRHKLTDIGANYREHSLDKYHASLKCKEAALAQWQHTHGHSVHQENRQ